MHPFRIVIYAFLIVTLPLGLAACAPEAPSSDAAAPASTESAPSTTPIPPEERDPDRLWCNEHGVYEDECLICHPELAKKNVGDGHNHDAPEARDPDRLWCNEHGVYEDECLICHPELAKKNAEDGHNHDHDHEHAGEDGHNHDAPEARDPDRLWCNEHGVYEDECLICHPELAKKNAEDGHNHDHDHEHAGEDGHNHDVPEARDPDRLWCNEHGVYEDECLICHPELAKKSTTDTPEKRDPDRLWCNAHGVYEDECLICHPELADAPKTSGGGLQCIEHDLLERECGICHPELLADKAPGEGMKVRFESMASVEKAGVRTGLPALAATRPDQAVLGQMTYNKNRQALISPVLDGIIKAVHVDTGDRVEAGQLLAEVQAPGLAVEWSAYTKAQANLALQREVVAREARLVEEEISARQDLEEARAARSVAEADLEMAEQRLIDMGIAPEDLGKKRPGKSSILPVRAPFAGTITERDAVMGATVERGAALFHLADLSTMWMSLSIPENQLIMAREGATVEARFDALPGHRFEGTLTWIASRVDETTRMLEARAEFPNRDGLLRQSMFGNAELSDSAPKDTVLEVPVQAIQYIDGRPVVFAKLDHDLFETRLVETGTERNGTMAILAGLNPTDEIVLGESYILKSEMLKARLGAGCVHN